MRKYGKLFSSLPRGPTYCRIGIHARVLRGIFMIFLELQQETKSIRISEQIRDVDRNLVEPPSEKDLRAGQNVTNKVHRLSGFQDRVELLTMHNCTCILLSSRERVRLFSSLPRGSIYCRIEVHARVLRGIFTIFS